MYFREIYFIEQTFDTLDIPYDTGNILQNEDRVEVTEVFTEGGNLPSFIDYESEKS